MESLLIVVHGAVSWVLMSAGATKAWHPEIASDLRAFGILPVGKGFLRALGVVEVGFGAGMNLGGSLGWVVLALVAGLFLLMTTQVGIWVLSGKRGDCGWVASRQPRLVRAAIVEIDRRYP